MATHPQLIYKYRIDTASMTAEYPPRWRHPNKQRVYEIACPPGSRHHGQIQLSRWCDFPLPGTLPNTPSAVFEISESLFQYELALPGTTAWYLNFAHHDLFVAYGSPLLAQDELQVAEHPTLGSLREALQARSITPLTVENGKPTPMLIKGIERRCCIATDANAEQLRPHGLYGNHFARASLEAVERAVTRIDPPTRTNLIAIEAPPGGQGAYTIEQILYILSTAYSGFAAAKVEADADTTTTIHTGFWGCGAYGGNRVLMTLLQLLAVNLAQAQHLIFHSFDEAGSKVCREAQTRFSEAFAGVTQLSAIIERIQAMNFQWGVSDGN
ncbi:MAG: cat protein [Pseudomonadota bacterium]|nr:cat protein [Pseudomonadota bacterium]